MSRLCSGEVHRIGSVVGFYQRVSAPLPLCQTACHVPVTASHSLKRQPILGQDVVGV